jgi:hypothetical protein
VDAAQPAEGGAEDEEELYEDPEDPFTEEVRLQKLEMQRRGEEEDDPDYISEDEVGLPQLMSLPARTLLFAVVLKISPTRLPTGNSLNKEYVQKGLTPFKEFGKITPGQWEEFVAQKTTEAA